MNVELHIERLVLDGLPLSPTDGAAVQAAVQTELTRLLTEGALAPALCQGGTFAATCGAGINVGRDTAPLQLGHQISQALYGGIGR